MQFIFKKWHSKQKIRVYFYLFFVFPLKRHKETSNEKL